MTSDSDTKAMLTLEADRYRRANEHMQTARAGLTRAVVIAYALGMRKADILRAIDHLWSREWLDRILQTGGEDGRGAHPEN